MIGVFFTVIAFLVGAALSPAAEPRTRVSIVGETFHINGQPTYPG